MREYQIFLASPGDVSEEREEVRAYFEQLNRTAALARGVSFRVVDWENYSHTGLGRPQELITHQTLERFDDRLVLVVVVMAQRFGTPSGKAESGTKEEIDWALSRNAEHGYPEVKFFFREFTGLSESEDPEEIARALEQWTRVREFRDEIRSSKSAYVKSFSAGHFEPILRADLDLWFHDEHQPWSVSVNEPDAVVESAPGGPPAAYFSSLQAAYEWLDIAGIDSGRAFKLPLEEIYVRLRVIPSEEQESGEVGEETGSLTIQLALERYRRLVIVGDPGSGKSTFLRFIALTLAQCALSGEPIPAAKRLSLAPPLPIPIFISCWDLSDYLQTVPRAHRGAIVDFVVTRAAEIGWVSTREGIERLLESGDCVLLIDGLDEVATDEGRQVMSGLIEELVSTYPENRYVVTSRIRGYTGGTVLGREFARCDVQPFDTGEREAFLQNWVRQLFRVREESTSTEASAELAALLEAIETSSIARLATNPLLLTVIAIVHRNRKRLPEQRVDLYDECIDVLLGQRKQAEHQRTSRSTKVFSQKHTRKRANQRVWDRKRFAEIAYRLLSRTDEEIDRAAVVEILEPHFRDVGDAEASRSEAEHYLEQQELTSGLLVRRGAASYHFVHLTFTEYLAAWHLSHYDLSEAFDTITDHVREPKWFETLQLFGGVLANGSDAKLDRYVRWLLGGVGDSVSEQAPVIALVANIVRDTRLVASLTPDTQARYEELLRTTLDAFAPDSRVPKQTQLDLLEALGGLGNPVKDHLIAATGSRLLDVRRRALEILVPHLSDDELFSMTHLLADRSREPVKTYLKALVERDRVRAGRLVLDLSLHGEKTLEAMQEGPPPKLPPDGFESWPELIGRVGARSGWEAFDLLDSWGDAREATWTLIRQLVELGDARAVYLLAGRWGDREDTWELLGALAEAGSSDAIRTLLAYRADRTDTWDLLLGLDDSAVTRLNAEAATWGQAAWPDGYYEAGGLVVDQLGGLRHHPKSLDIVRRFAEAGYPGAVGALARDWADDKDTWSLIARLAESGSLAAMSQLAGRRGDRDETWQLLEHLARAGSGNALLVLLRYRADRAETMNLIDLLDQEAIDRMARDPTPWMASSLRLVRGTSDHARSVQRLLRQLAAAGSAEAMTQLDFGWSRILGDLDDAAMTRFAGDYFSDQIVRKLVDSGPRGRARREYWSLLRRLALAGSEQAVNGLTRSFDKRVETWEFLTRWATDGSEAAVTALAQNQRRANWPLIERRATEGSEAAVEALLDHRSADSRAWEVIRACAESGSVAALHGLAHQAGDRADTWELIERVARQGSATAGGLIAWRDWAIATAGPSGPTDLGSYPGLLLPLSGNLT